MELNMLTSLTGLSLLLTHSMSEEELVLPIKVFVIFLLLMAYLQSEVSLQESFEVTLLILSSFV